MVEQLTVYDIGEEGEDKTTFNYTFERRLCCLTISHQANVVYILFVDAIIQIEQKDS